jgi:hypothetical protein
MSSNLQNKLFHYEATPPEKVWDEVAAALDSGIDHAFTRRLQEFEATPPPSAWTRIEKQLSQTDRDTPVIPFFKKYRRPLKIVGAAAAILFLAVITSLLLVSKKSVSETPMEAARVDKPPVAGDSPIIEKEKPEVVTTLATVAGTVSKEPIRTKAKAATQKAVMASRYTSSAETVQPINYHSYSDKYMMYSDGNGHSVRLPKKIYDFFVCPEHDLPCRDRLKGLQQKIAASALSPGFTGMLDMIQNLQENK